MATPAKPFTSLEDYLRQLETSEIPLEYYAGEVFPLDDAIRPEQNATSRKHGLISVNIGAALHRSLRGSSCQVSSQTNVQSPGGLWACPDLVVTCGQVEEDRGFLLNPIVIIEIVSPSTEVRDRGLKFELYSSIPSLREYLLVAQDRKQVTRFVRRDPAPPWEVMFYSMANGSGIELSSIGAQLMLTDIYEGGE